MDCFYDGGRLGALCYKIVMKETREDMSFCEPDAETESEERDKEKILICNLFHSSATQ